MLNRAWDEFTGLFSRQIIEEDMLWRELEDRWGEYFEGGMGAAALARLIDRIDFDDEEVKLRSMIDSAGGSEATECPAQAEPAPSSASRSWPHLTAATSTVAG